MSLQRISLIRFRNLAEQEVFLPSGMTLLLGPNGSGKTNFLEAVSVLGNVSSFRNGTACTWIRRGSTSTTLAATIQRSSMPVELRQEISCENRITRHLYRGARRLNLSEYLQLMPVTTLSSVDPQLILGGPATRRRFLDRVAFHLHPETLFVVQRYHRSLKQRNAMLARRSRPQDIEPFEHELANAGARLIIFRQAALDALLLACHKELDGLGWSLHPPTLRYHAPDGMSGDEVGRLAADLRTALSRSRRAEISRGHTLVGPHRHDVAITIQGVSAREILSAGQTKLLATAMKLAAQAVIERMTGNASLVVFDDVDAELDADVLSRLLVRLTRCEQVVMSSAHGETILPRLPVAAVWRMSDGHVNIRDGARSEN